MPLSDSSMSSDIKAQLQTVFGSPVDSAKLQEFCDALGKAIVENIKANALISGTVTSGAGSGGTVTGTVS